MIDNKETDTEKEIDLLKILKLMWNDKKRIIKFGFFAGCVGIIVAFSIPKTYISKIIIVPESSDGSSGMSSSMGQLASIAGVNMDTKAPGITKEIYSLIIKSNPFVMEFASIPVLCENNQIALIDYFNKEQKKSWWSSVLNSPLLLINWISSLFNEQIEEDKTKIDLKKITKYQSDFIKKFNSSVTLILDKKTSIIDISCKTQSPEISLQLLDSITNKLQVYMYGYKTAKVRTELNSNNIMLKEARKNFYRADSIYAVSTDKNNNVFSNKAISLLDRLENEKELTFQIYKQIASQVELNKVKLNEEIPIMTILEPATLPINASYPNKLLIIIVFSFLGGFIAVALLMFKNRDIIQK